MKSYNSRVLAATPAANMGIDQVLIESVLLVSLPWCLTTLTQERGHSQHHGVHTVIPNWKLFIKLLISITLPPKQVAPDEPYDHEYVNSMITAKTPDEKNTTTNDRDIPQSEIVPLGRQAARANIVPAYNDLINIVNFLFFPDLKCLHLRSEWYLFCVGNEHLPASVPNEEHPCCGNACYVCNLTYTKYMLPIVYKGALAFLKSEYFSARETMP